VTIVFLFDLGVSPIPSLIFAVLRRKATYKIWNPPRHDKPFS